MGKEVLSYNKLGQSKILYTTNATLIS